MGGNMKKIKKAATTIKYECKLHGVVMLVNIDKYGRRKRSAKLYGCEKCYPY